MVPVVVVEPIFLAAPAVRRPDQVQAVVQVYQLVPRVQPEQVPVVEVVQVRVARVGEPAVLVVLGS